MDVQKEVNLLCSAKNLKNILLCATDFFLLYVIAYLATYLLSDSNSIKQQPINKNVGKVQKVNVARLIKNITIVAKLLANIYIHTYQYVSIL